MREIHLIDTSGFCRILRVPNMGSDQEHEAALAELGLLASRVGVTTTFLLPVAAIYETGNHIAQNGDGNVKRKAALRFTKQVQAALDGQAPWTPTPLPDLRDMATWLTEFPDRVATGTGLGDLSIIKLFEQQCELNPLARVRIWSTDEHLSAYDRLPTGSLA
ncbi:MAG: hypothetical protein EOO62_38770 [Hymenobacter sp.]|nr:MAG: hypothetical protein EOO62_38770 [Hymenobacter sp.]